MQLPIKFWMKLNLDCMLKVKVILSGESVYSLHIFNPEREVYNHICKDACGKKIYISTLREEGCILRLATFCNSFSASKLYDY